MKIPHLITRDAGRAGAAKVAEMLVRLRAATEPHRREATVVPDSINVEARTVELSFSSEIEYQRYWGIEILGHDANEVDLSRLSNKAAVLWMHDWNDQRGVVEAVRIDGDRKGRAIVRFSKSPAGEQLFQDIIDGIVTKVSVGYTIDGLKLVEERDDTDVYRVTSWTPYEISMVSVPADDTVGVGRQAEIPREEVPPKPAQNPGKLTSDPTNQRTDPTMNEKILRDAAGNLVRAKVDGDGKIVEVLEMIERAGADAAAAQARGADAERARVRELTELGKAYNATERALQFIAEGKTAEDLRRVLLDDYAKTRSGGQPMAEVRDAQIGMTEKETRAFSLMKAIRVMADPQNAAFRNDAAFELECSRAAAERYGKNPKGVIIPADVLTARSFGQGGGGSSGGGANLVATNLLAGSFIELLRHKAWVMKRARTLAGLVGNVDIPRQNAATQAYWVGEAGSPTGNQPGIDQIAFSPKTVGATTDITRRLMMQATPDAEIIVRDDILKVMALEIDRVAIYGSGSSNQPMGLKNITGISSVSFGTPGQPSFAELVQMETDVALADADVDGMSYSFNAGIRGHLKTTLKFPGVNGSQTIWEQGNTVNGYGTNTSNQILSGEVYFGNWMDLVIAMWGGLELTVDPYSLSTSGGLRLVALQDIDINIRHKESFTYGA
jgi:HK97 family phage major capsid protein/HK97 family phage prohead protease